MQVRQPVGTAAGAVSSGQAGTSKQDNSIPSRHPQHALSQNVIEFLHALVSTTQISERWPVMAVKCRRELEPLRDAVPKK